MVDQPARLDIDAIVAEIIQEHEEAHQIAKLALDRSKEAMEHAIRCGELLHQIKNQMKHGAWGKWIKEQDRLPFGERQAQRYMRIAKHPDRIRANASSEDGFNVQKALNPPQPPSPNKEPNNKQLPLDERIWQLEDELDAIPKKIKEHRGKIKKLQGKIEMLQKRQQELPDEIEQLKEQAENET